MNKGGPHCPRLVTPIPAVKSRYFCPSAVYTSSPSPFTTTRSRIRPRPCETCSRPKSAHCSGVRMRAGMLEVIGYDFPESGQGGSRYGDPCPRHRNPGDNGDFLSNGSRAQPHDVSSPKAKGKRHVANADDHLDLQEICLIRTFFQFPQTVQQDRVSRRQVKFANACSVPGRTACDPP